MSLLRKRLCSGLQPLLMAVAFFLFGTQLSAQLTSRVLDQAEVLSPAQIQEIETALLQLEQRWQTPMRLVTLDQMGSAAANNTLGNLNNQLYAHPNVDSAVVLVWNRQQQDILMSFGPGWNDQDMSDTLIAAAALFQGVKGQPDSQAALPGVVDRIARQATARQSVWQRFLLLQRQSFTGFWKQLNNMNPVWLFSAIGLSVLVLFVLELIIPWRRQQSHKRPQLGLDLFYTFLHKPLFYALIGSAVVGITDFLFREFLLRQFGVQNWVAIELGQLPHWIQYLLLFLLVDFLGYWGHRALHASDTLWRLHQVHHSALQLDVFNGIRQHIGEDLFYRLFQYLPLGLFGFGVVETFWVALIQSFFSTFTHANVRLPLGPLKYLFNNPQLHVWHHTRIEGRGNVNFGDALSCWDFIFGTGYAPGEKEGVGRAFDGSQLDLGFEDVEHYPKGYFGQLLAPFRKSVQASETVI